MRYKCKQSGLALLLVLILVASASVLGLSYVYGSSIKLASSNNLVRVARARYLAESGLYHGLCLIRTNPTVLTGKLGPYCIDDSDDSYYFAVTPVAGQTDQYTLSSQGNVGAIAQSVSLKAYVTTYEGFLKRLNPIHYWRLGETSGPEAYDPQGLNHGAYMNGVELGLAGATEGDMNKAVKFDGVDDYIDLQNLDISGGAMTIIAWVYPENYGHLHSKNARIVSKATRDSLEDTWWMLSIKEKEHQAQLRFRLKTDGGTEELDATSGDVPIDQWTLAAAVYDGSQMRLYQNGVLVGSDDHVGEIIEDPAVPTWIGGSPEGPTKRSWRGRIDEVAIFNYALNQQQIRDLYDARISQVRIISWNK